MENEVYSISEINALTAEEFLRVIGPAFEHSTWIARQGAALRPFDHLESLHRALCEIVSTAPGEKQIALIQAHPDLVGRAALEGTLTPESTHEQASAGLGRLAQDEIEMFQEFNAAYQKKFGFPFVICARLNKNKAILSGFGVRLKNRRDLEIKTALEEIFKIAFLRLQDLIRS